MTSVRAAVLAGAAALAVLKAWQAPSDGRPVLQVVSPLPGEAVRGVVRIAAAVEGTADRIAAIDYEMNGRAFGRHLRQPPFEMDWHSALIWDGPATIQAVARDVDGVEVARSAAVAFQVANGDGTVRLIAPDLSAPLRGTVNFVLQASHPDGFEAWSLVLDGHFSVKFGNTARQTFSVDTTRLANGPHDFATVVYSRAAGHRPLAMAQFRFTTENGKLVRALRPAWSEIAITPGATAAFGPRAVFTDGSSEPVTEGVTYESGDREVAVIDEAGTVTGVAPGTAMIIARWRNEACQTRVRVTRTGGFPHFSRDGEILSRYDPERSLFVRTLFHLNNEELRSTPGLPERVRAASINALTVGFYNNPADNPKASLNEWKSSWDEYWDSVERDGARYDLSLLLTADDIARTPKELDNSIRGAWSGAAIQHALTRARDSKRVIGIEMTDEVSFVWGDSPEPNPTDAWQKLTPSIPGDAFQRLMAIMRVPGRPPVSWPTGGSSPLLAVKNWLGNAAYSDYSSLLFTWMDWRRAYPYGASLPQDRRALERVAVERSSVLQSDRPMLMQTSICGPFYIKRGAGDRFTPGQDIQQEPPVSPVQAGAQILYAAAAGAAGVRVYSYDWSMWKQERSGNPAGSSDLQTGADPFRVGRDRWESMAAAFGLIAKLEPALLQTRMSALDLGDDIVTAARTSETSRLFLAINFSEIETRATVDLRPYRIGSEDRAVRFRLYGAQLKEDSRVGLNEDDVTFRPGETIVWLFETAGSGSPAAQRRARGAKGSPPSRR